MLNTVIFDMDGLLVDSEPLWGIAMKEVFATVGLELSAAMALQTTGLRTREVVHYWHSRFKWTGNKSREQVENEIIDTVTQKVLSQGVAMEGLEYILEFFRTKGFKMGLASSSPMRLIQSVLSHLGIKGYFQAVISAEFEAHGKPHPAVYLACARELDSHSLQCVAFEDSVNGMIAAKAARMKAVVVPEPHNRHDRRFELADLRICSLLQFGEEQLQLLQQG